MIPKAGLDKVVLPDDLLQSLQEIVQFEKARLAHLHVMFIDNVSYFFVCS